MSRIDPGLYDFVTDDFLGDSPVDALNTALSKLKAMTGPQLAADSKAKRAVRDGIDRIYRELDARAKGGTSVPPPGQRSAPKPDAPPVAKAEAKPAKAEARPAKAEAKPAKAEAKPAKAEAKAAAKVAPPKAEAKPVAKADPPPVQPAPPAAPTPVAAVDLPEGEEFEEEDDSETYGEAGDFD